ncbi:MAG TPA: lipopolysaccharide heptosyltransferase II [Bacteroidota bacterium]
MLRSFRKILVIQTAFLGDVILTLPLIQVLKKEFQEADIDVVATPQGSGLLANHPSIRQVLQYDKRGEDKGVRGFFRLSRLIKSGGYDLALLPHRSIRSALLALLAHIPVRIGFDKSAAQWMYSNVVGYKIDTHEIERNLSLLEPLSVRIPGRELPTLHPGISDRAAVDRFLDENGIDQKRPLIAIAPGTVWNTKRWLKERFAEVARTLAEEGCGVVLVGGNADRSLCLDIKSLAKNNNVLNSAGDLTLLQSAELIRRSRLIVSNDSAPMHMGVAVHTPVIAIFGATVPAFGFAPYGSDDVVVETLGLTCRPCSIHGGAKCPIKTFDCMMNIEASRVLSIVRQKMRS